MTNELNFADAANILKLYQDLNTRYIELSNQVAEALKYLEPPKVSCDCVDLETLEISCGCQNYDDYCQVHDYVNTTIKYRHIHNIFYPNSKEKEK